MGLAAVVPLPARQGLGEVRTGLGLFPVAIEEFTRLEGVTDKTRAKILWDNCTSLYKLPTSVSNP